MRAGPGLTVSAPSSSLLRFLRSQSDEVCFFTPFRVIICHNSRSQPTRTKYTCKSQGLQDTTRHFSTNSCRKATVESSLLNLDLLRPLLKHGPTKPPDSEGLQHFANIKLDFKHAGTNRRASTDTRFLFSRLWKPRKGKETPKLKPSGLPPLPSFLDDVGGTSISRSKAGKAANDLKLRCTEFDNDGKVTLMDGEFKKTELIAKVRTFAASLTTTI